MSPSSACATVYTISCALVYSTSPSSSQLFAKLGCDDTEMLAHTRELLEELEEGGGDDGRDNEIQLEDKLLPKVEEDSEQQHEMETT